MMLTVNRIATSPSGVTALSPSDVRRPRPPVRTLFLAPLRSGELQIVVRSTRSFSICRRGLPVRRLQVNAGTGDQLCRGLSSNAEVVVFSLISTALVLEAQARHKTAPTATAALGRALMGTLLLGASRMKTPNETVQMNIQGDGPLGAITCVASRSPGEGLPLQVKGLVGDPACDLPVNAYGKLDVGGAVGQGSLRVVRSAPFWKQPYIGSTDLVSGEIAEDLALYLAESEQINSSVGLGVLVGPDMGVLAAGGFLVEVLPQCSEETIERLEANLMSLPAPTKLVSGGATAQDIVERILDGIGVKEVTFEGTPSFGPCDVEELRGRMLQAITLLGPTDARQLLEEQGGVEVRCEFCAHTVKFGPQEVESTLASLEARTPSV